MSRPINPEDRFRKTGFVMSFRPINPEDRFYHVKAHKPRRQGLVASRPINTMTGFVASRAINPEDRFCPVKVHINPEDRFFPVKAHKHWRQVRPINPKDSFCPIKAHIIYAASNVDQNAHSDCGLTSATSTAQILSYRFTGFLMAGLMQNRKKSPSSQGYTLQYHTG